MLDPRSLFMALILLEALLALLVLLLIVWWTMFSGRKKGELVSEQETQVQVQKKDSDA
jgi:cbb3-type cytochrome oxidase subunit 3